MEKNSSSIKTTTTSMRSLHVLLLLHIYQLQLLILFSTPWVVFTMNGYLFWFIWLRSRLHMHLLFASWHQNCKRQTISSPFYSSLSFYTESWWYSPSMNSEESLGSGSLSVFYQRSYSLIYVWMQTSIESRSCTSLWSSKELFWVSELYY